MEARGKRYAGIGERSLVFSPDNGRVAYWAGIGKRRFTVVDGKEEKSHDIVGIPLISPDSQRLAYQAIDGAKQFVVVNGNEGRSYHRISADNLVFSLGSRRLAYQAGPRDKLSMAEQ